MFSLVSRRGIDSKRTCSSAHNGLLGLCEYVGPCAAEIVEASRRTSQGPDRDRSSILAAVVSEMNSVSDHVIARSGRSGLRLSKAST